MPDLKAQFDAAAAAVQTLAKRPDNEAMLQLYSLYKQATAGNASGKRPGFTDPVGRAKFDAWSKLQGMSQDQAMQSYIDLATKLQKA
jgi:acyl-CoA-binding protein